MAPNSDSDPSSRSDSSKTLEEQKEEKVLHGDVSLRERLHHFTWTWFTTTMSTSGIALLISQTPHRFRGLTNIGEVFFILSIVMFLLYTAAITTRFILFPKAFMASLSHPAEALFFPTFWISIVSILSSMAAYGVPDTGQWFTVTMRILFWLYTICAFSVAVGQYFFLFTGQLFTLQSFTPAWILPIFPIMLCGTLASVLGPSQTPQYALPILIAGLTFQGLGMILCTTFYSIYLGALMVNGLPSPSTRPRMFVAVSTDIIVCNGLY
jgi:tellurite resistance protein TehA-like permease